MSKRYPPIFNVILFAVAVIFMLLNPISNMIPWLPEAIKTAVAALCVLSALTLSIIIANIIVPNFYQFTITQCFGVNSSDVTVIGGAEIIFTIIAPFIIAIIALLGALFSIPKMEYVER